MKFMDRYPGIRSALEESDVTIPALRAMFDRILVTYDALAPALPDAMGWKRQKPAHARHCAAEASEFAPILGFNELERAYFAIPFSAHDLGRMIEGLRKCLRPDAPENLRLSAFLAEGVRERWPVINQPERMHGADSAELLTPILGPFADSRIGQWTLLAVALHSDKDNPTLEMVRGVPEALALCNILRDLDKVEGFREAKDYVGNPERKARERLQNWPQHVQRDPLWGTELGRIDPEDALDSFCNGQAIDRSQSRSYERYMLQYLAWAFNIVQPEMLELALHEGGPQIVATYLLAQLEASPDQAARFAVKLQDWENGALLHLRP